MNTQTEHLPFFVYGTLLTGESRDVAIKAEWRTEGELLGFDLFDTGRGYPAIVLGTGTVHGELCFVAEEGYERTLRLLDHIEGFRETSQNNLYLRTQVQVQTPEGEYDAWTYIAASESLLDEAELIVSGNWRTCLTGDPREASEQFA